MKNENHGNIKTSCENYENHENLRIPYKNYENHEKTYSSTSESRKSLKS